MLKSFTYSTFSEGLSKMQGRVNAWFALWVLFAITVASGLARSFNMYAIGLLTPYLMRYHGIDIRSANFGSMVVYAPSGAPGLLSAA